MAFAPWYFRDTSGQTWKLGVTDGGLITTTLVPSVPQASPSVPLLDADDLTSVWNFYILPNGMGATDPTAVPPAANWIPLTSLGGIDWRLYAVSGILQTVAVVAPVAPVPPPVNFCYLPWYLDDGAGGVWLVSVQPNGQLTTTAVTPPVANTSRSVPIKDSVNPKAVWALSATPAGLLSLTAVSVGAVAPWINLEALDHSLWRLSVLGGLLDTTKVGQGTTDPTVGQLFNYDLINQPGPFNPASQPAGPNTPVTDPVQTTGELIGQFFSGCGHSFNAWEIMAMTVECIPSAGVRCPICGFLQRIITPYSDIYAQANEIIMA